MCLAENLKFLRKERNMSQADVADLLGYKSLTTISKWESGENEPPFGIVKKLSDYYGVSMQTLATVNLSTERFNKTVIELDPFEVELLTAYRNADKFTQGLVIRSLGLDEEFKKDSSESNSA